MPVHHQLVANFVYLPENWKTETMSWKEILKKCVELRWTADFSVGLSLHILSFDLILLWQDWLVLYDI